MSGRGPTPDDIDNYHRLCVEFEKIHPSDISNLFKQCEFDYAKARCILRGMAEEADDDYFEMVHSNDTPFNDDDISAYIDDSVDEPPDLPINVLVQMYINTGWICDDPDDKKTARRIMPNEMNAIEKCTNKDLLPKIECVCRDWLLSGYCENKECPFLHSLYGVVCSNWTSCANRCCPFVHTTIADQCARAREKLGMEIARPDEPTIAYHSARVREEFEKLKVELLPPYTKAAWEAFQSVKCPPLDEINQAFPGERFIGDFADIALCDWPEKEEESDEDRKLAQFIMDEDKSAGVWKLISEEVFDEKTVIKYHGLERLWSDKTKAPFLEMLRAYNNEREIHGRMRMFHLIEAVKCKGDEAKEHLRLARIHYNRECFLNRDSCDIYLHMANAHYGLFSDTNERVLYLYGLTVTETRDILKQLFDGTKPQKNMKFFVFAQKSREKDLHFVTLDDIRKYCRAKDIPVVNHGDDSLEFVY